MIIMNSGMDKYLKLLAGVSMAAMLCSCAVYDARFTCPDSRGANCVMLSKVDEMVDSGEIEVVQQHKKCKGRKCKVTQDIPKRQLDKTHKVKLENSKAANDYQEHDHLYLTE